MKPPYIIITQNGSSAKYRLNPEYDGLANIRTRLFEYSVTNDAKTLPNGLFVLISLPVDIKTKKCKVFSNHKIQNPRYAGHTKGLSTKSAFKVEATAEIPSIIPIVDTIFLPLPATTYYSKKAQWFIQFKSGDEWSEHRVFPSEDGGALLIPASVFHDSTIEPFYFSIYEKDLLGNWTYPLYEYLYAVPLPTK